MINKKIFINFICLGVDREIHVDRGKISFPIVSVYLRSTNDFIHIFLSCKCVKVSVDETEGFLCQDLALHMSLAQD